MIGHESNVLYPPVVRFWLIDCLMSHSMTFQLYGYICDGTQMCRWTCSATVCCMATGQAWCPPWIPQYNQTYLRHHPPVAAVSAQQPFVAWPSAELDVLLPWSALSETVVAPEATADADTPTINGITQNDIHTYGNYSSYRQVNPGLHENSLEQHLRLLGL